MSLDLVFASKGAAGVLAEMAKLRAGSKLASDEIRAQGREQQRMITDVGRAYLSTRTEVEKLEIKAEKLRRALANTKLPPLKRAEAEAALGRVEGKIKDINNQAGKADTAITNAFGGVKAGLLGSFATAAGGAAAAVAGVIKVVTDEMRAAQELADRAQRSQMTAFEARRELRMTLGGATDEDREFVLAEADRIAADQGVLPAVVDAALAQAVSANPNPQLAAKMVDRLLPLINHMKSGDEIGRFVGGVGDIANALGTEDADRALGVMQAIMTTGRPTDIRAVAKEAPRVLTSYANSGIDPRVGAAMFAGLTVGGADKDGEISRTAALNLITKSEKFFKDDSRGFAADEIDTAGERISLLMRDAELARKFIDEVGFRAAGRAGVQALLLDPNSKARDAFKRTYGMLGDADNQRELGLKARGNITSGKFEPAAGVARAITSTVEQFRLASSQEYLTTEQIDSIREMIQRSGDSATATKAMTFLKRFSDGDSRLTATEAAEYLGGVVEKLRSTQTFFTGGGVGLYGGAGGGSIVTEGPTEEELSAAKRLETLMEKLLDATNSGNEERKKQTAAANKPGRTVGAD